MQAVVLDAIQRASTGFRRAASPLLEKERHPFADTMVPDTEDPCRLHGPGFRTAFSTDDHPRDPVQVEVANGTEERFNGQEPSRERSLLQVPNSRCRGMILNRHAAPDMPRGVPCPIAAAEIIPHDRTPFGQDLEYVSVRRLHDVEHLVDELRWNVFVEQVAHGIHEHHAGFFPFERLGKAVRSKRDIEPTGKRMTGHTTESLGEPFGVTVVAAPRDLGAARHWVPRGIGPLDLGFVAHGHRSLPEVFGSDYLNCSIVSKVPNC